VDQIPYEYVPGAVPSSVFGGAYGVPTSPAHFGSFAAPGAAQPQVRNPLALRYLGGIFHDSTGESAYLDPGLAGQRALSAAPDAPTEVFARIPSQGPVPGQPSSGQSNSGQPNSGQQSPGQQGSGRPGSGRAGRPRVN
jgi:hypothetical protein